MSIFGFLAWHYWQANKKLIQFWLNFSGLGLHFFSVFLLWKTLFAPWRRIESRKIKTGFSLADFFNRLIFNLISRTIGFFCRLVFIFSGTLLSMFLFLLGLAPLLLWQVLPFFSWIIYLNKIRPAKTREKLLKTEAKNFVFSRLGINKIEEIEKVDPKDVEAVLDWYLRVKEAKKRKYQLWREENIYRLPSLAGDLAFGYTLELDKYSVDLAEKAPFSHQLVGRKKEIKQIESVLTRAGQANILLIGEPGVGKETILRGLAKAINEKNIHPRLFYKRVLKLDLTEILGKAISTEEAKAKIQLLIKEARQAGNIILVIDNVHEYTGIKKIDLTQVICEAAGKRDLQIIAITTPQEYSSNIFKNEEFLKYFEVLEVKAPDKKEAMIILQEILPYFEKNKKIVVAFSALKTIIDLADDLITHIPFPEKAIDLLDQLINEAQTSGKKIIEQTEVEKLVSLKTKVPLGALNRNELEKLKQLDQILHRRIIGQEEAITAIVKAMQRAGAGISNKDKPLGVFLFLGPTGVGKTETAKALAECFFIDEEKMIRFDMSQPFSFSLFIRQARENPYGVLLLDEFEKASRETIHLFLTVFDEGYLKDENGKQVSFKNMIIICTSNAGAEFIRQKIKAGIESQEIIEHILLKNIFSPEIINRFDSVVVYKPLALTQVEQISSLQVAGLAGRLEKKGYSLITDPLVYRQLAVLGYNPEFGARPLKRLIADKIEGLLAQEMLLNRIKKGEKVKLTVDPLTKEFKIEKG